MTRLVLYINVTSSIFTIKTLFCSLVRTKWDTSHTRHRIINPAFDTRYGGRSACCTTDTYFLWNFDVLNGLYHNFGIKNTHTHESVLSAHLCFVFMSAYCQHIIVLWSWMRIVTTLSFCDHEWPLSAHYSCLMSTPKYFGVVHWIRPSPCTLYSKEFFISAAKWIYRAGQILLETSEYCPLFLTHTQKQKISFNETIQPVVLFILVKMRCLHNGLKSEKHMRPIFALQ